MRLRTVAALLAGSTLVSTLTRCASSSSTPLGAGRQDAAAIVDVLSGEEATAEAAPPGPGTTVDEVACDKTYAGPGGTSLHYAEKEYPGRSKDDLARAVVLDCGTQGRAYSVVLPGYTCVKSPVVNVRDGAIASTCAETASGSLRFIVPPPL